LPLRGFSTMPLHGSAGVAIGGRNVSSIIGVLYTSVAFGTLVGPSARRLCLRLQP
jgi:hypothetical protein